MNGDPDSHRLSPGGRATFALLMLAPALVFAVLGFWQLERLAEKEALIAAVTDRIDDAPMPFLPVGEWDGIDPAAFDYRPVTVTGQFNAGSTIRVFTSLLEPRGEHLGPGYWVMSALELPGGGAIFVNRGFVPQYALEPSVLTPPTGTVTIAGLARRPERLGSFTPGANVEDRIEWIRDPDRLAALSGIAEPVAPLYIDLPAGPPGELPQGGETVLAFPNNHLGYALTWFGFALLTPILLTFWLRRTARRT